MASNDQKTELFFKTFNNTVNADQGQSFAATDNKYPFRDYVLNESIFSNDIPSNIADFSVNYFGTDYYGIAALDLSNSGALGGTAQTLGISYELLGTNLKYYYKVELDFALANNFQTWYLPTDDISSNNSLLRDSIPFNYDSEFKSYFPALYDNAGTYAYGLYSNTVPWLMDYKSGFIEYYTASNNDAQIIYNSVAPNGTNGKPRFSFVKYIGAKGASGGGGGGGGDISFNDLSVNNLDVSNNLNVGNNLIVNNTQFLQTIGPELLTINTIKFFRIAQINMSDQLPANSGPTVCSGRFMIKTQEQPSTCIEFIAGFYSDKFTLNDPPVSAPNYPSNIKPFIKVIHSNGEDIIQNGINFICIGIDGTSGGDPDQSNIELIIGFKQGSQPVSNATVRLYDNNEGTGNNDSDYRDWTLDENFTFTTGPLNTPSYNIVKQVNIDTFNTNPTGNSVAISSLDSETFMGNVNVGEKLTVLNGIDISGDINIIESSGELDISGTVNLTTNMEIGNNLHVSNKLVVDGDTYLKDVSTNSIYVKPGSTVWTTDIRAEYIQPRNYFNMNNEINFIEANIKFNSSTNGGHIIDVSAITSDGDNLLLNGGLEFNNASDISNTIVNFNSIYPSEIIGSKILNIYSDILNIYGDIDMSGNITNINTIIPGQNQNNLLTISGDLLVDGSLNILSISPTSGSNIDIFGNLLMNDFKISNVGELIMNGNIDLALNNIENVYSIKTKNIIGDSSLNIQTIHGDIDIDTYLGDVKIQANIGNLNLSQRLVSYNSVELDMSGDGILDITTKNGQNPSAPGYATGGLEITTINNKDKAPHTFYNAIPSTLISELSNNDMPNGSIAVMKNIGFDVQSQYMSLPIIKLSNNSEGTSLYKYMYLGNENIYTFFNRRPGRDDRFTTRGSDTTTGGSPYTKDISSGFVPNTATRYVQGSGGISYWYWDVSNTTVSLTESICKFEVSNPISQMNPLGRFWTTTDYSGNDLTEWEPDAGGDWPVYAITAIPSRNNIGPYTPREGYITEISYYFPFWQQSETIGIAGPIIFRNLGTGSPSDPDAPYVSLYIDASACGATSSGGNPIGDVELKRYPASASTPTLIKGTGDTITLPPEKWIYVGKNANLSQIVKMKIYIPPIGSGYDGMSVGVAGGYISATNMANNANSPQNNSNITDMYDIGAIQGHLNIVSLPSYISP